MNLTSLGAAQTTTGSMHLIESDGMRILLDCGLYQGRRKESFERNRNLPVDAASIDAVLLSHAHIDHSGNLPSLVKAGFDGPIYSTPATADLCSIMLRDSAHLQEMDVRYVNKKRIQQGKVPFEPLYTKEDVQRTLALFQPEDYASQISLAPELSATFFDAGHILGSAVVQIDYLRDRKPRRLLFTGDLGQRQMPIIRDPTPVSGVHVLLTESTYGNRLHPVKADVQGRLKSFIEDIVQQRAKLIIPAFSVGRTQQLLYFLNELVMKKRIPPVPIYVDSPLSTAATAIYKRHRECFDEDAIRHLHAGDDPFVFPNLKFVKSVEESKALNLSPGPAVIISASGMCEGGRILHHLKHSVSDPRNIVLIVGYQAEHTLGRRIVEHKTPLKIYGEEYELEARVHTINALSAHADSRGLLEYFDSLGDSVERVFTIHGEEEPCAEHAANLRKRGAAQVDTPEQGVTYENI